jgi:lysozyme
VSDDDLPLTIDVEWFSGPASVGAAERACNNPNEVKGKLKSLAQQITGLYGKRPVIYTTPSGLKDVLGDDFQDYAVWIAKYPITANTFGPRMPGRNPWTLWQYTPNGRVPGVQGDVDLNAFFGTETQFAEFKRGGGNVALLAATQDQK